MIDDDKPLELDEGDEVAGEGEPESNYANSESDLEPGFHVNDSDGNYNSGPYETEADAQAFIDSHLAGSGKVFEAN